MLVFLLCLGWQYIYPQQTLIYSEPQATYNKAVELYRNQKYSAARQLFETIVKTTQTNSSNSILLSDAAYYIAKCATELFNPDAEKLCLSFIEKYPENSKVNSILLDLGRYHFRNKRYAQAIKYFDKADPSDLSQDELCEYTFKKGYCYFRQNKETDALREFADVKDKQGQYAASATYYFSHIQYNKKHYNLAIEGFEKLRDNPVFKNIAGYYLVQIYFLQGKYDELIALAVPLVKDSTASVRTPEIIRLIGESYYRKDEFKNSIPYLQKYIQLSPSTVGREDYYQLGYAYYKNTDYKNALKFFIKILERVDSLSQNASYHIGDCYIKTGQKIYARNAFLAAANYDFYPEIKENALYNYTKLSYELSLNPYNEAIIQIQKYIKTYPDSDKNDELYSYLVNIYLTTKNFKSALISIENIKNKDAKLRDVYKQIAYNRAVELFNNYEYNEAILTFNKLAGIEKDKKYYPMSFYWKGEAFYRLNKYDSALFCYKKFIVLPGANKMNYYSLANYNAGYCSFKQKDYKNALISFRKLLSDSVKVKNNILTDAQLRTADCYFVEKEYNSAIAHYEQSVRLKSPDADYAVFQKALSLGLLNKYQQKIEILQLFQKDYKKSEYLNDAIFELANTYLVVNDNENALKYFQSILLYYPNSIYTKRTLLKEGLVLRNLDKDEEALAIFQRVVAEYPGTPESQEALVSIKNIYVDMDKVEEFFVYVKNIPFANVTNAEQDSLSYVSVENKYMSGDCDKAIKGFSDYLEKYPDGFFIAEANFYRAECEYARGLFDEALAGYNYIIGKSKSKFTEDALLKAAEINHQKKKNYTAAIDNYINLEKNADLKNNLIIAITGQMRLYYMTNDFNQSINTARRLLLQDKLSNELIQEAHLTIAKAALQTDSIALARQSFNKVISLATNEAAAEARYNLAYIEYRNSNFDESEKIIFQLINQVPSYDYWIAKAFILLADNYIEKGNLFQAKHTLQSIIDNYEGEDLVVIAKDKLKILLEKEKALEQKKAVEELEIKLGIQGKEYEELFNEPDSLDIK